MLELLCEKRKIHGGLGACLCQHVAVVLFVMCLRFDGAYVGLCMSDACVGWDRCAAATAVRTREGVQERTAGRAEQRQSRGWGIRAPTAGLCSEGFVRTALLGSITKFSAGTFYFGCFSVHLCSHLPLSWASGPPNCGSPALVEEHRSIGRRRSGSLGNLWMPSNKSLAAAM